MKVTIICVGKITEKFFADAVKEYQKRISRFAELEIIEVADEKIPSNASEKELGRILDKEGERILSRLNPNSFTAALCVEGEMLDSPEFARRVAAASLSSSRLTFIIGGSCGLSEAVKRRADLRLSFGRMTLPHRLMRVVLAEQIYRAFMINSGAKYHK